MSETLDRSANDGKRAKSDGLDLRHIGVVSCIVCLNHPDPAIPVRIVKGTDDKVEKVDEHADGKGAVQHESGHDRVCGEFPFPDAECEEENGTDDDHGDHRGILPSVLCAPY